MKKENGFTLVEAIVALFIGSLMLVAIYAAVNSAQTSASRVERRVSAQQDARGALDLMAMEIQMASYNSFSSRIWVSCSGTPIQEYKGIQEATANSITIEMDITNPAGTATDGDGIISGPNEIIRYNYDSTNQYITRSTNCAAVDTSNCTSTSLTTFLGAPAACADTKTVLVVNNTAGTGGAAVPVFRYYNGSGTELTAPVTTSIPDIRRIEITLVIDTSSSDQGTNTRRRIIYSTSVIPRNHSIPFI